jgi:hypothetical protein
VASVVREDGGIASLEVEGACVAVTDEDGGAPGAGVKVEPFLRVGMPVKLVASSMISVGRESEVLARRTRKV